MRGPSLAHCFAPVVGPGARILVLGSVPGQASARAAQYYAHPRNAFWPIMGELFGAGRSLAYADRLRALQAHHIALWDVLASCDRPGSLDADIEDASIVANDLAGLLGQHPQIDRIVFNGTMAEHCFRRYAAPALPERIRDRWRLPSTSPAHAAMPYRQKLELWREALLPR